MPAFHFSSAAVIGTGMMGPGIAVTLALGGVRTTLLSRSDEGSYQGLEKARAQLDALEGAKITAPETADRARGLLASTIDFNDTVRGADLVVESAPEDMEFKKGLFARLDSLASPETVLATNTSGLSVTEIASGCEHPERILTTHFWNPPHAMPLVEIVMGEKTSPDAAAAVRDLLAYCGKTPVVVKKDRPGQLGNRLQMALWREAMHIVAEGIATAEDVDLAAKAGFGLRLPVYGIFEHADAVGLDMVLSIMNYVARDLYNQPKEPDVLRALVARGELGAKTGKGFHDWSKKDIEAVKARRDQFVLEFLAGPWSRPPDLPQAATRAQ